ncbi:MAG TPA: hypothetical protein VKU41_32240 [Polyangiaceae bacterium]|nr:hypothetical protein [Polyangiaceae bacterium]
MSGRAPIAIVAAHVPPLPDDPVAIIPVPDDGIVPLDDEPEAAPDPGAAPAEDPEEDPAPDEDVPDADPVPCDDPDAGGCDAPEPPAIPDDDEPELELVPEEPEPPSSPNPVPFWVALLHPATPAHASPAHDDMRSKEDRIESFMARPLLPYGCASHPAAAHRTRLERRRLPDL